MPIFRNRWLTLTLTSPEPLPVQSLLSCRVRNSIDGNLKQINDYYN